MSFTASNTALPYYIIYMVGMIIWRPYDIYAATWFWAALVLVSLYIIFIYIPRADEIEGPGMSLLLSMIIGVVLTWLDVAAKAGPVAKAVAPWVYAAACPTILLIIHTGFSLSKKLKRHRRIKHAITEIRQAKDPESLVPFLHDHDPEIRKTAEDCLSDFGLSDFHRAQILSQVLEAIRNNDRYGGRLSDFDHRFSWIVEHVKSLTKKDNPDREALLLLYEYLGIPLFEDADKYLQDFLFETLQWEDGSLLYKASEKRLEHGGNVDRMVTRLLETDQEAAQSLAGKAFLDDALTAKPLAVFDDQVVAKVLHKALEVAKRQKFASFDEILDAAYNLQPKLAFPVLSAALDESLKEYSFTARYGLEYGLLGDKGKLLMQGCADASAEVEDFISALKARISVEKEPREATGFRTVQEAVEQSLNRASE